MITVKHIDLDGKIEIELESSYKTNTTHTIIIPRKKFIKFITPYLIKETRLEIDEAVSRLETLLKGEFK